MVAESQGALCSGQGLGVWSGQAVWSLWPLQVPVPLGLGGGGAGIWSPRTSTAGGTDSLVGQGAKERTVWLEWASLMVSPATRGSSSSCPPRGTYSPALRRLTLGDL